MRESLESLKAEYEYKMDSYMGYKRKGLTNTPNCKVLSKLIDDLTCDIENYELENIGF